MVDQQRTGRRRDGRWRRRRRGGGRLLAGPSHPLSGWWAQSEEREGEGREMGRVMVASGVPSLSRPRCHVYVWGAAPPPVNRRHARSATRGQATSPAAIIGCTLPAGAGCLASARHCCLLLGWLVCSCSIGLITLSLVSTSEEEAVSSLHIM